MRITTGIDIVSIERMEEVIQRWGERFLNKLFTQEELCQAKRRGFPVQHFAGKFAGKEAIFKALSGFQNGVAIRWTDIEILNSPEGRPKVYLHDRAEAIREKALLSEVQVSISHNRDWAVASAVAFSEKL